MSRKIDIIFDGPPDHEAGRFVEVEDDHGRSLSIGEWIQREDGFWSLRILIEDPAQREVLEAIRASKTFAMLSHQLQDRVHGALRR